jgi:hypothetical protein
VKFVLNDLILRYDILLQVAHRGIAKRIKERILDCFLKDKVLQRVLKS